MRLSAGIMQDAGFEFYKSVNGVWLTSKVPTQYIKRETFDEKDINTVVREIDAILLRTELDDESLEDTSRADVIFDLKEKYSWEVLQQALFHILLDENKSEDAWYQMAVVFWIAVLESRSRKKDGLPKLKFKKKTIIGLLYYRLRKLDYAENLIWSITCELYHLDYCNSIYDPVTDKKIIRKLEKYGLAFK